MAKGITTTEFVCRAREIHGDKYDYSNVFYKNSVTKVCIVCPIHGEFWQKPSNHVNMRQGCPKCARESCKKPVFGVGINDTDYVFETREYKIWRDMLERCYCEKTQTKFPTYKGCSVCEEWKIYSNFKKWFHENYIDGWELDKDILCIGNKVYSPQTCCFVPREINSLLRQSSVNGKCGIHKKENGTYFAIIRINGRCTHLRNFNSFEDAKKARDRAFIQKVVNVVDKYKDLLPRRTAEACLNYHKALYINKNNNDD